MSEKHYYHLLNPSPWPLYASFAVFCLALGGVCFMHGIGPNKLFLTGGILLVISAMCIWWYDVIRESIRDKALFYTRVCML